jgi:hypothetical protein
MLAAPRPILRRTNPAIPRLMLGECPDTLPAPPPTPEQHREVSQIVKAWPRTWAARW